MSKPLNFGVASASLHWLAGDPESGSIANRQSGSLTPVLSCQVRHPKCSLNMVLTISLPCFETKLFFFFFFPSLIFQSCKVRWTTTAFYTVSSLADIWVYRHKSCSMCGYSVNEGGLVRNKSVQANFDIVGVTF